MRPILRGAAAALTLPALVLPALVATSAPASAAADPVPAERAATWLESQLTDGIVHNDEYGFDDLALTGDVAFALEGLGGHDDTVAAIMAAIEPRAHDEWYTSTYEGVTTTYAGSLAKAAALVQRTGGDTADFGGHDLIAELEATVSTTGATAGRVQDENNDFSDTNTFGQAFAAEALDTAGSELTDPVTDFLLAQQCEAGWFRLDFAARDAADQTCDGDAEAPADPDATAIAVLGLLGQDDDTDVAASIDAAVAWLLDRQKGNGAWGGGPTTAGPNANSTGVIGSVMAAVGESAAAEKAAAWVRAHQLVNVGRCTAYAGADLGAIAYDNAARGRFLADPITAPLQDQVRRATSQALGVLALVEDGGEPNVLSSPDYVRAGSTTRIGVNDAAPGEALCAERRPHGRTARAWATPAGDGHLKVKVPRGAGVSTHRYRVSDESGVLDTVELTALGRQKLAVSVAKQRVPVRARQTIVVRGLAPGELTSVDIAWAERPHSGSGTSVAGQANRRGVFRVTFDVLRHPGVASVQARGQFKGRAGATQFTVVR